jgi:molecular chaperone HscB
MSHPDHFALFALPARFALDETALESSHKAVQTRVHPDRFATGTAAERRVAMQWAARANEAIALKSPRLRAAYL